MGTDIDELKGIVTQTLESRGVLGKIKAQLRANVFNALTEKEKNSGEYTENRSVKMLQELLEARIALGLVCEFLEYYELDYTLSVLQPEANISESNPSLTRDSITQHLRMSSRATSSSRPLIVDMIANITSPSSTGSPLYSPSSPNSHHEPQSPRSPRAYTTYPSTTTTTTTTTNPVIPKSSSVPQLNIVIPPNKQNTPAVVSTPSIQQPQQKPQLQQQPQPTQQKPQPQQTQPAQQKPQPVQQPAKPTPAATSTLPMSSQSTKPTSQPQQTLQKITQPLSASQSLLRKSADLSDDDDDMDSIDEDLEGLSGELDLDDDEDEDLGFSSSSSTKSLTSTQTTTNNNKTSTTTTTTTKETIKETKPVTSSSLSSLSTLSALPNLNRPTTASKLIPLGGSANEPKPAPTEKASAKPAASSIYKSKEPLDDDDEDSDDDLKKDLERLKAIEKKLGQMNKNDKDKTKSSLEMDAFSDIDEEIDIGAGSGDDYSRNFEDDDSDIFTNDQSVSEHSIGDYDHSEDVDDF